MRLKNVSLMLLIILFASTLSSCKQINVKDTEICADLGNDGAYCFHTFFDLPEVEYSKEAWDEKRYGMYCMEAESFANLKEAILRLCARTKKCSYELMREVERLNLNENTL